MEIKAKKLRKMKSLNTLGHACSGSQWVRRVKTSYQALIENFNEPLAC